MCLACLSQDVRDVVHNNLVQVANTRVGFQRIAVGSFCNTW
jgi:hypothetical protein